MRKKIILLLIFPFILWSCGGLDDDNCKDLADANRLAKIEIKATVIRLENEILKLKDSTEVIKFLDKYPDFAKGFYNRGRLPDSIITNAILKMNQVKEIKENLSQQVSIEFKQIDDLKTQFEEAFRHVKYYYPDFKIPTIYTTITGLGSFLGNDLYMNNEAIVISLDFFLQKQLYPIRLPDGSLRPDYINRRSRREYIVPTCIQYLSNKYNQTDFMDKTMLAEMIHYGKSFYFTKTMLPCTPDSLITGYSRVELANISDQENRNYIWNHFIEKKLLFETNETIKRSYLFERPYIAEINSKCPGRIAQWLGWRIIKKFMLQKPETQFTALMKNRDVQYIFQQSNYKGD
jgi:hypothetical protein